MDLPSDSKPTLATLPSRWARAAQGESDAFRELAASYWYCVYVWWRRTGLEAEPAATATAASFTRWAGSASPTISDSGAGLMRQWLPARLEELAAADWEEEGEPAIEVEREWAEQHYADEPEGEPGVVFDRRWTLTVLEFAMQGLRAEYAARGMETLFAEASPFVGFEGADEEHYAAAAERMGMTLGAMRRAIFDLRTHHRDLLRTIVADTVADPAEVDGEITSLLCAYDLPGDLGVRAAPLPTSIRTFKPDELLARAMNSVHMTGGGVGTQWNPPSDAEAARLFPQYEMRGLVGRGAMGAVYRARQVALDRDVAIKLLPVEVSVDPSFADRFVREARAMAKLSHPNIISVYNFGTTSEGHLFFVMEYVEGADLSQIIRGEGLAPHQAMAIAGQVCLALAYAHGKGVIHRDIKPPNVMVNTEGVAKVADFGLARLSDASLEQAGQTVTGTIMGTEEYMAPEQKRAMAVDHRADIYSMGVMLYEMICKEPPQGAFEPPSERVGCDARIDQIVLKAMSRLPEDRYQSAMEMKVALDASLAPRPATRQVRRPAPPTTAVVNRPPYVAPAAPIPTGWIAGLVVAVLLAAGAFYFLKDDKPAAKAVTQVAKKETPVPLATPIPKSSTSPIPADPSELKTPGDTPAVTTANAGATAQPASTPALDPKPAADAPANAPAPKNAMEKWLEGVDGPQQETFQKQVTRPYEAGMEELRKSYVAALDAGQAKASATGNLDQAIIWNDERKAFEESGLVEPDDSSTPAPLVPLRAAFRTKLAKLESERVSRAKPLVAGYDTILAKNVALLTQRGRTEDALLLKNKREEIAKTWLEKPAGAATVKPFATKDRPFVNTLGMKFVPVPITGGPTSGRRVLFSVWETRRQDYEGFATETGRTWEKGKDPLHPVAGSQWDEAQAFCAWLTERERKAGKLAANEIYRLPTDHEWSCAVGIGEQEDAAKTPSEKGGKIADTYPWGSAWPPPAGAGNYTGKEMEPALAAGQFNWIKEFISDYQDGFVGTAPVGSFAANRFGLYDLGGNALEWCEDWSDSSQQKRVMRGGAWDTGSRGMMTSARRWGVDPNALWGNAGFRVVLSATSTAVTAAEADGPWKNLLLQLTAALVEQTGDGWSLKDGTLASPDKKVSTIPLPGSFSGTSYQLRVRLRRLSTLDHFHVVLPVGDRMTGFELDGWGSTYTGLNAVNGKTGKDLAGVVEGRQVKDAEPHDLEITVRLNGADAEIATALDSRPLYTWAGPIASLTQNWAWATTPRGAFAFGTLASGWTVSEIKVKRLGANSAHADADTNGWTDLLAPLTPAIVGQTGQGWRLENGKLFSSKTKFARLPLADTYAGTSYRLKIKLQQVEVKDIFRVALPVGDRAVCFYLDGNPGEGFDTALGCVDGGFGRGQRGAVAGKQIKDSALHELEVTVRLDGPNVKISSTLDAQPLHEWAGPIASLSMIGDWAGNPPGTLALGSVADDWVVSEIKAKRLNEGDTRANTPASRLPDPKIDATGWADLLVPLTPGAVEKIGHGWRMKGGTLVSPDQHYATLPLPGTFSGASYQLRIKLRQLTAKDLFRVILPIGDRMTGFEIDWTYDGITYTGLSGADGKDSREMPGVVLGKQVKDSERHDLEIAVRLNGANATFTATLDTRPLFEWTGPVTAPSQHQTWATTPPGSIALGTMADDWVVSEVKVKRLGGK